ncbi:MAG: hypothetical protein ACK55Z_06690, partial [bacterium]
MPGCKAIGLENGFQYQRPILLLVHGCMVRRIEPQSICLSYLPRPLTDALLNIGETSVPAQIAERAALQVL